MRRTRFFFGFLFFAFCAGWFISERTLWEFITWIPIGVTLCSLGVIGEFVNLIAVWNDFDNGRNVSGTYPVLIFTVIMVSAIILEMLPFDLRPSWVFEWVKKVEIGVCSACLICFIGWIIPKKSSTGGGGRK